MSFREIYGQEHAIDLLNQAVQRDRMPHAWLFTGQANIGKYKTAVALAQKLNCRKCGEDACGECDICFQISEQNFLVIWAKSINLCRVGSVVAVVNNVDGLQLFKIIFHRIMAIVFFACLQPV